MVFSCPHCHRNDFKSARGLSQHISGVATCLAMDKQLAGVIAKPPPKVSQMFMNKEGRVAKGANLKLGSKEKRARLWYHDQDDQTMGKPHKTLISRTTKILGSSSSNLGPAADKMDMIEKIVALQDLKGEYASFSWALDKDDGEDDEETGGAMLCDREDDDDEGELVFYGPEDRPDERPAWQWDGLDPLPLNPPLNLDVPVIN